MSKKVALDGPIIPIIAAPDWLEGAATAGADPVMTEPTPGVKVIYACLTEEEIIWLTQETLPVFGGDMVDLHARAVEDLAGISPEVSLARWQDVLQVQLASAESVSASAFFVPSVWTLISCVLGTSPLVAVVSASEILAAPDTQAGLASLKEAVQRGNDGNGPCVSGFFSYVAEPAGWTPVPEGYVPAVESHVWPTEEEAQAKIQASLGVE